MLDLHLTDQSCFDSSSSASNAATGSSSDQLSDNQPCWGPSWTTPQSQTLASPQVQLDNLEQHSAFSDGSLSNIADYLTPSSASSDEASALLTPSTAPHISPNTSYAGTDSCKQTTSKAFNAVDGRTLAAVALYTNALRGGHDSLAPGLGSASILSDMAPSHSQELQDPNPFAHLSHEARPQQESAAATSALLYPFVNYRLQDWRSLSNHRNTKSTGSILDQIIGSCNATKSNGRAHEASAKVQSSKSGSTESYEQDSASNDPTKLACKSSLSQSALSEAGATCVDADVLSLALMSRAYATASSESYLVHYPSGCKISLVDSACISPAANTPLGQQSSNSSAASTSKSCFLMWQKEGARFSASSSVSLDGHGQPEMSDNADHCGSITTDRSLTGAMEVQTDRGSSPGSCETRQAQAELATLRADNKDSHYEREKGSRQYEYLAAVVLPAEGDQESLPYSTKTDQDPRRIPSREQFEGDEDTRALAQEPKLGAGDLYTPKFVKGHRTDRQGWCDCGKWLGMKSSVYNYHASICHGVSCRTGRPFAPPTQIRWCKELKMVDAHCHNCDEWVNIMRKMMRHRTWKNWFVHASHCHHKAAKPKSTALQLQPAVVETTEEVNSEEREQPAKKRSSAPSTSKTSIRLKCCRTK
ncbi:hypothetical protein BCV69DRAFT_313180 [Microstroma glucosiphilum]|uniref:Transcription regulator Rua1 C-terminal domain-containing protein n=1 Tax=Pseudomicrostroma glucosiphilum TaxID=1684307 RepID=A0A316U6L0_9BASI|nr:hypothetical protein BCV69DRAFT_313180 [Pseudomicrostroma glucosiphilum]PWN19973.1 hypothetical protein BCV69DRAFT_313180 [Pseudomicrostroma glucosiphilum]